MLRRPPVLPLGDALSRVRTVSIGLVPESRRIAWIDRALAHASGTERATSLRRWAFGVGAERAVRRALLRGVLPEGAAPVLAPPRAEADRVLDALIRLRSGETLASLRDELERLDRREFATAFGNKSPAAAIAHATTGERFDLHAPDLQPGVDIGARARELSSELPMLSGIAAERTARRIAMLGAGGALEQLRSLRQAAGRRAEHALLAAEAVYGHRDGVRVFAETIVARDVDPGRGFTQRRISADALGELGLQAGVPWLLGALDAERRQFEGRPGAGLGIQYPVRANVLRALGEIGAESAIETVLPYLDDVSGSAFGGFYLPAMDTLVKIGPGAIPAVRAWAARAGAVGRANAEGVLRALEQQEPV